MVAIKDLLSRQAFHLARLKEGVSFDGIDSGMGPGRGAGGQVVFDW